MKKYNKIVLLAVLLVALAAMFCACNLIKDAKAISIKSMPKTSYIDGDTDFDWSDFVLTVEKKDNTTTDYTYEQLQNEAGFYVSEFDGTVGTHTATVKYLGCSISFSYTVAAQAFAGGEGTKANPYQISTAEQFGKIGMNTATTYFVLINDLDMTDYAPANNDKDGDGKAAYVVKNAVIDGNNYAIRNLKGNLIRTMIASTLKNVDLYINSQTSIFYDLGRQETSPILLENINIYGVCDRSGVSGQNIGLLTAYIGTYSCTLRGINIYADFLTNAKYGAIFVGYTNWIGGTTTFDNCKFYGYAQGGKLGVFLGNGEASNAKRRTVNINGDSGNYGTMVTTMSEPVGVLFGDRSDVSFTSTKVTFKQNGTKITTAEQNKGFVNVNGEAKLIKEDSLKLTLDETTKELSIACDNVNAINYKIIVDVWTYEYKEDRTTKTFTNTFTLLTKELAVTGKTGVYFASWVLDTAMNGDYEFDSANNQYKFNDAAMFDNVYVKANAVFGTDAAKRMDNVRYTVYAYDAQGQLLGSYTYGL